MGKSMSKMYKADEKLIPQSTMLLQALVNTHPRAFTMTYFTSVFIVNMQTYISVIFYFHVDI